MRPGLFLPLLFCFLFSVTAAAVPRYEAAWKFAGELQQEFSQRPKEALIARSASDRMCQRLATPLGAGTLDDPRMKEAWDQYYWPAVQADLEALSLYETLFVDQIALLEGERVLGCVLQRADGAFFTLLLWLEEQPDGRVVIVDYRSMGELLEMTRRFRHLMILIASWYDPSLDEEERVLAFASEAAPLARDYFEALRQQKFSRAFELLSRMPDNVKRTRLWRDLRDKLALSGHQPAVEHAFADVARGLPLNVLIALGRSAASNDVAARLAALDRLVEDALQSPFGRVMKAAALLDAGQVREAHAVASEVYRLNPFSAHACALATRAAIHMQDEAAGLEALNYWARLADRTVIDQDLARDASLSAFRASPAYRAWLETPAR